MSEKALIVRTISEGEGKFVESLKEFASRRSQVGPCDKCGQPVPSWNNVAIFEFINTLGDWTNKLNRNRHLTPVVDEHNVVICEGSPSRSQYLAQGMMETRSEYPKNKEDAQTIPVIFDFMQRIFPH